MDTTNRHKSRLSKLTDSCRKRTVASSFLRFSYGVCCVRSLACLFLERSVVFCTDYTLFLKDKKRCEEVYLNRELIEKHNRNSSLFL